LQEIRGGRLSAIPDAQLTAAFVGAFEGPVPREVRFLNGESIGELLDRVVPALQRLLAQTDWDTALLVAHGGVNRALLSWFLTGERVFLGGLAQDPGCLNVIDVGPDAATSVVRVVNFCPIDTLQTASRLSTMEHLLQQYLRLRRPGGDGPAGLPCITPRTDRCAHPGTFHRCPNASTVTERHRFDEARLAAHLSQHLPDFAGPLEVRQFQGGQSNPTYLLLTPDSAT
jgi:hypothetical protein